MLFKTFRTCIPKLDMQKWIEYSLMASQKMYFHFNKGLLFEIKKKKIIKSNEGILLNNDIFRNRWHCWGGPLSRPQEGIFSSTSGKTIWFPKRSWEPRGEESVNQKRGMERSLQLSCMYASTLSCQPASQCSWPGILLTVFTHCGANVLFPEWLGPRGNLYKSFLQIQDSMC